MAASTATTDSMIPSAIERKAGLGTMRMEASEARTVAAENATALPASGYAPRGGSSRLRRRSSARGLYDEQGVDEARENISAKLSAQIETGATVREHQRRGRH